MNILIYTQWQNYLGYTVGGAETSLRMLAEKLAKYGHNVHFLTELKEGRRYKKREETINGVRVHFVNLPDLPTKGIGLLLKVRSAYIEYRFAKTAEEIIRDHAIDLVHTYHEVPGMYRFLQLKERKNLNYATVLRNGGKYWVKQLRENPDLRDAYRYVFNSVDSVNFNTPGMETLFDEACGELRFDVDLKHRFVHDIGLNLENAGHHWELPEQNSPFRMIMASRFSTHQKRQRLLVEAVAKLPKEMEWELNLVGEGPTKKSIRQLVVDKGIEEKVTFYGFLEQEKLWGLMKSCHLYVHACDFEGLSKIIIEAMGMGVPVLASDVVPLRDYINDGDTGFLVENNATSWKDKMFALAQRPEKLTAVSMPAKKYVEDHFSADKNVKAYLEYFKKILAGQ